MSTKVSKDKNGNYEGHSFALAMLEAKLSGNHIKVMLAYMNIGGFNPRDAVFLCRKDYERFGIVRQTLSKLRTELVEAGWLKRADKKSAADYEYFYVTVGGPVAKRDTPRRETGHPLSQNETPPVANHDIELTTELTKNNNELSTVKNTCAVPAPVEPAAGASDSSQKNKNIKDKEDSEFTDLIVFNGLDSGPVENEGNQGVSQITTPSGRVLTLSGELEW